MKNTQGLRIHALIAPGITLTILLLFTIGETVDGDWSGLGHLLQAIPGGLGVWVGWKRPLWGGMFLLALSLLASHSLVGVQRRPDLLAPFLILIGPLFLSGVLFLWAARLEKRAA